jgi:hypothetical protein
LNDAYQGALDSLTLTGKTMLRDYTGSGYYEYNSTLQALAKRNLPLEALLDPASTIWESPLMQFKATRGPDYYARIKEVQSAIAETAKLVSPPPPELVWRGTNRQYLRDFLGNQSDLVPGDVVSMSGFQSTSIDPNIAIGFSKGILLEIKPIGGTWLEPITAVKFEREFLLPSDAKYRVIGTKEIEFQYGPQTVIQLEMLP